MQQDESVEFTKRKGAARAIDYFRGSRCKGEGVEKFFPEKRVKPETYGQFCSECPIQEFCLDFALCFDSYGVWGGLTRDQRKRLPQAYKDEAMRRGKEEGWYQILADVEEQIDAMVDAIIDAHEEDTSLPQTVFSFSPPVS